MKRRKFILNSAAGATGMVVLPTTIPGLLGDRSEPLLKNKNVLFVWGGWEGHEPRQCRDLFVPWMQSEGAEVSVFDTLDCYTNKDLMEKTDLIVQIWTMGKISKEQEEGLLSAVKNGAGLAGWHGGIGDAFRESTEFQFMCGGQWVAHPGGVIDYEVNVVNHQDAVTKGLSDFRMHSEQYYMHVDPNVKVLATTTFSGEHAPWIAGAVMPVTWKKYYGKGCVFYSSLGHVASDFDVPEAMTIMQRGIRWASESKYGSVEKWIDPVYGR